MIGSANASENSAFADDAAIITDNPEVVVSVRKFIDGIDEITEVDEEFIGNAAREWEIGRAVPIPGVSGRIHDPETEFLPFPVTRMFVKHAVDYEPSPTEHQGLAEHRARQRTTAGAVAKYQLESLRLDIPAA